MPLNPFAYGLPQMTRSMSNPLRITIWNEFIHEREQAEVKEIYPQGIHQTIADALAQQLGEAAQIRTATLDQPDHGLTPDVLAETDVLFWWGHVAHAHVADEVVTRVQARVLEGMGLGVLHSGHEAKIFQRLLGTTGSLRWREAGERERVWYVLPGHPILDGLEGDYLEIEHAEMYGEHFDIPQPDELLTISWFQGGEVFRSGCVFYRGRGKIFYFRPGHETYPIYHMPQVQKILANAALYLQPAGTSYYAKSRHIDPPLEKLT